MVATWSRAEGAERGRPPSRRRCSCGAASWTWLQYSHYSRTTTSTGSRGPYSVQTRFIYYQYIIIIQTKHHTRLLSIHLPPISFSYGPLSCARLACVASVSTLIDDSCGCVSWTWTLQYCKFILITVAATHIHMCTRSLREHTISQTARRRSADRQGSHVIRYRFESPV
jgi:hypothetical protein